MSEKRTHEELAAKFLNDLSGHNYEADPAHAIGIIDAAEERGRRRGLEEAHKAIANEANDNRGGDYERRLRMLAELVASLGLAPRDSAPLRRCCRPAPHPGCEGWALRDSGEEG